MGKPSRSDRVAKAAAKLTPSRELSGCFTRAELDQLEAAGYTIGGCLIVPGRMDPGDWSRAVDAFAREQRDLAERMMASLGRRAITPESDVGEPE